MTGVVQFLRAGGGKRHDGADAFLEQSRRDYSLEVRPLRLAEEELAPIGQRVDNVPTSAACLAT